MASKMEQGAPEKCLAWQAPLRALLKAAPTCRRMLRGALIGFFVASRGIEILLHCMLALNSRAISRASETNPGLHEASAPASRCSLLPPPLLSYLAARACKAPKGMRCPCKQH